MNFKNYVKRALRTESKLEWIHRVDHALFWMTTEVAEMVDNRKKNLAYWKPLDIINLKEEIWDLMRYVAILCDEFWFNFDDILEKNIDKLRIRFPEKFSNDNANNRDLEAEREALEKPE